jgi:hypothetical protein
MGITIKVKAIVPKKVWSDKAIAKEINAALEETGKELDRQFERTTFEWDSAPKFKHTTGGSAGRAWVHSFPTGSEDDVAKWVRLDEGTREHSITPRGSYPLRFPWQGRGRSYLPHTTPGHLVSHPGGVKLGPIRSTFAVTHPGTEARRWSIVLGEQEKGPFLKRILAAIEKGLGR